MIKLEREKLYYCLDLQKSPIKKFEANGQIFYDEAKSQGDTLNNILNNSYYDVKIFDSEKKRDDFYSRYKEAEKKLSKKRTDNTNAALLYKKRYLVQTIMGEKKQTFRNSERVIDMMKKVKVGEDFTLYDQTHFLTVKLTKVKKSADAVKYEFETK